MATPAVITTDRQVRQHPTHTCALSPAFALTTAPFRLTTARFDLTPMPRLTLRLTHSQPHLPSFPPNPPYCAGPVSNGGGELRGLSMSKTTRANGMPGTRS